MVRLMKPTDKQVAFLKRKGYEIPQTKQECTKLISSIINDLELSYGALEVAEESYGDR